LRVLWPPGTDKAFDSANEESIVLLAQCGDFKALLTGDAESAVLEELARAHALCDVDVLKVGHHGSNEAVDEGVLQVLRPELAVVSVGEGNRFGHPARATLDLLAACGARTLRTDKGGDITLKIDGGSATVESGR
jgi:beta-lactamase superfamily II metal-dependent hydrolase